MRWIKHNGWHSSDTFFKRVIHSHLSLTVLSCLSLVAGCANPYEKFYYPISAVRDPSTSPPEVRNAGDAIAQAHDLEREGYRAIGGSSFMTAGRVSPRGAAKQGQKVGADLVLCSSKFLFSEQAVMPVINYQPGQVQNSYVHGSVYSGGQFGTYNGTVTTTTPGTYTTQYIPYTRYVCEHVAVYLRKPSVSAPPPAKPSNENGLATFITVLEAAEAIGATNKLSP